MLEKNSFSNPRYWYHLSTTLFEKLELLSPRDNKSGFNRSDYEPNISRICVSPTIEQCLVAIPYSKWEMFGIYKTISPTIAKESVNVFDSKITDEGWILIPTYFERIGCLSLDFKLSPEAASEGNVKLSQKLLQWWKRANIHKRIVYDSQDLPRIPEIDVDMSESYDNITAYEQISNIR